MLANPYRKGIPLSDYWVSEKYDGVRGYWNGHRLLTRGGEEIHAPEWFTRGWPSQPLDGELWAGRGRFEFAVSAVRRDKPDDAAWRQISFMLFDLPGSEEVFDRRQLLLIELAAALKQPWMKVVPQHRVADHAALARMLDEIEKQGGEGLMLHRGGSLYRAERSDDLLKFKPQDDAEARVVAHLLGKGKYQGMLGALLVETLEGVRFKLGSGLSDALRRNPPEIGSIVTYRYRGRHAGGIPRFATYLRIRGD
jgi:DNA ligase-1